jgi:hypothetical protein
LQPLTYYLLCSIRNVAVEHEVIDRRSQHQRNNKKSDHKAGPSSETEDDQILQHPRERR